MVRQHLARAGCLLALAMAFGPVVAVESAADAEVLEVSFATGGPAPFILITKFQQDGTVQNGPLGEAAACGRLSEAQLGNLRKAIAASKDVLEELSFLKLSDQLDDSQMITFSFPRPLEAWMTKDIGVPPILLPVGLVSLVESIDLAGTTACPKEFESLMKWVPKAHE